MKTFISLDTDYPSADAVVPATVAQVDKGRSTQPRVTLFIGADLIVSLSPAVAEAICDALCGAMADLADPPTVRVG